MLQLHLLWQRGLPRIRYTYAWVYCRSTLARTRLHSALDGSRRRLRLPYAPSPPVLRHYQQLPAAARRLRLLEGLRHPALPQVFRAQGLGVCGLNITDSLFLRDCRVHQILEGTNEIMNVIVGRSILK